jgi:hypothetical protein
MSFGDRTADITHIAATDFQSALARAIGLTRSKPRNNHPGVSDVAAAIT